MNRYDDILDARRPDPPRGRPRMPQAERAKQFMPFSTLRGYGDILADREIGSEDRAEGDDEAETLLNERLGELERMLGAGERPKVALEMYEADRSLRLHVVERSGRAERLSVPERTLRVSGRTLSLDDVRNLRILPDETGG